MDYPPMKRLRTEDHSLFAKQQSAYNFDARKLQAAQNAILQAEKERANPGAAGPVVKGPASKAATRRAGGKTWRDDTMDLWPEGDFRVFVGNLGNEVTDEMLTNSFGRYPSLVRAKVVRNKHSNKSKGYGFVSFMDPFDCAKALREMNGKYIGNRPCKLTKSTWKERTLGEVRKREKKTAKLQKSWGITTSPLSH